MPGKHIMIPCAHVGCTNLVRRSQVGKRGGFCREHTDWSKHSDRITQYNVTVKTKPKHLKYRTEKIPSIDRVCIVCGLPFKATPAAVSKGGGIVCSRICQGIRAAQLTPKHDTSIERSIEKALKDRGWNYQKQVPLCGVTLADFYLPDYNAAIYCDGVYWHNLPNRQAQDAHQNNVLTANGYNVYRFTETEINLSPIDCLDRIDLSTIPRAYQLKLPIAE